jgi:putative ABC transport system ATP-binding protein
MTMPETVIEVVELRKQYGGGKPVLDGISFTVKKQEFVTIYGKSGCGKTTLLNILGGLDRPTSGRIEIDGQDISGLTEDDLARVRLQKIGFVFQDYNLLMDLTVSENVALPMRLSRRKDPGRVDDLLKRFDIAHVAGEKANRISGGEAQRAAIARALMNNPKIILADEPTGNLDQENTENVIKVFQLAIKDFGMTVILATHDRDLAEYASTRVFLSDGRASIEGEKPESTF